MPPQNSAPFTRSPHLRTTFSSASAHSLVPQLTKACTSRTVLRSIPCRLHNSEPRAEDQLLFPDVLWDLHSVSGLVLFFLNM